MSILSITASFAVGAILGYGTGKRGAKGEITALKGYVEQLHTAANKGIVEVNNVINTVGKTFKHSKNK